MNNLRPYQFCMLLLAAFSAASPHAGAVLLLDSGSPSETGNLSVFYDAQNSFAQWLAQPFTLANDAHITSIEAYIGGRNASILMTLARAIGPTANATDALGAYSLALPGTSPHAGAFVGAPVGLSLAAGTYYLVFSSTDPAAAFMPTVVSNPLGDLHFASLNDIDMLNPHLSDFYTFGNLYAVGVRVYGDLGQPVIPEPLTLALIGAGLPAAMALRRRRA